jgi:hypothetical protein
MTVFSQKTNTSYSTMLCTHQFLPHVTFSSPRIGKFTHRSPCMRMSIHKDSIRLLINIALKSELKCMKLIHGNTHLSVLHADSFSPLSKVAFEVK